MSGTQFVLMYHPALNNERVLVSLSSVDDHAAVGWLLVDGVTPAPTNTYLTPAVADSRYPVLSGGKVQDAQLPARLGDTALRAAYVPRWKASTAYAQGDLVVNPSGQLVTANAAFTSGSAYSASNWTVTAGGAGGSATTSASDLTSGTLAPARIADGTLPATKLTGTLSEALVPSTIARTTDVTAAVSTKYSKPSSGIPAADLSADAVPQATATVAGKLALGWQGDLAGTGDKQELRTKSKISRSRLPQLTKYPARIIGTPSSVGLTTLYSPVLFRVPDSVFAAYPQYGRWRCYVTTDHDSNNGGLAIGACMSDAIDTPANWTWLRTQSGGAKWFYDGNGRQTETFWPMYDEATSTFRGYYQVAEGSTQFTRVATSPDGINWTPLQDAIPNLPTTVAGWNHTGYAKVFYLDGIYAAWHLQGSGAGTSAYGWSWSKDGLSFTTDRRRVGAAVHMTDGVLRAGISTLVEFRGQLWAILTGTEYVSGSGSSSVLPVYAAPIDIRSDLRSLVGRPQKLDWPTTSPETSPVVPPVSFVPHPDGRLVGAYRINGATGAISLAVLS